MADHLVTYDLASAHPDPWSAVLEAAGPRSWYCWYRTSDGVLNRLPNTTLIGDFVSLDVALSQFRATVSDASRAIGRPITVTKMVIGLLPSGRVESDEHHP